MLALNPERCLLIMTLILIVKSFTLTNSNEMAVAIMDMEVPNSINVQSWLQELSLWG